MRQREGHPIGRTMDDPVTRAEQEPSGAHLKWTEETVASTSNDPVAPAAVPHIPGYEIKGRLGEGGMGTVWRAVQLSTRREVALKLMSPAAFGSQRAMARFAREVELTAGLEHPNVSRVYDSGLRQGVYFYAMELVEGAPLDRDRGEVATRAQPGWHGL